MKLGFEWRRLKVHKDPPKSETICTVAGNDCTRAQQDHSMLGESSSGLEK